MRIPLRCSAALLVALPFTSASAQLPVTFPGLQIGVTDGLADTSFKYVLADIDADGVPDIAGPSFSYSPSTPSFFVVRGLPGGGFATPQLWPMVGSSKISIAVGDLDGDPWPDVVLGDFKERVVLAHGAGGGAFGFSAQYFVGNGKPQHVAIADVNHDGRGDVISGTDSNPGWINVNLGDAVLGLQATQAWPAGIRITDMELGDLNGDGWTDVVCCDATADRLAVVLGNGAGGFLPAQIQVTADNPRDVLLGSLDGDADLDGLLITAGPSGSEAGLVSTLLGNGLGSLSQGAAVVVGLYPYAGALHDLDEDGDLDAAVLTGDHRAALLLNNGAASFAEQQSVAMGSGLSDLLVFDATGDGVRDLFGPSTKDHAAVFPALADGSFPIGKAWLHADGYVNDLDVARINGDDFPDVVFCSTGNPTLGTLPGSAGGLVSSPVITGGYVLSQVIRAGDLDGDDHADVVTAISGPSRLQIGHGLGNGAFAAPQLVSWGGTAAPGKLALSDVNGDGWRDVLASDVATQSQVLAFLNGGAAHPGQFGAPAVVATAPSAVELSAGDLDDDGDADLLLLAANAWSVPDTSLNAWLGDGAGGFSASRSTPVPLVSYDAAGLALADVDLDGRLDAVVGDADGRIALALGDGAAGFAFGAWSPPKWEAEKIAVADVDGDGWPDVLDGGYYPGSALVLRRGDGTSALQPAETFALSDSIRALVVADIAQDGRPDVVVASYAEIPSVDSQIQFLPNIAQPFTWKDLGFALAGLLGEPELHGTGALLLGTPGFVRLTQARPSSPAVLFVSSQATPTPFKGGMLVPVPPALSLVLFTSADGTLNIPWLAWPSDQPGASWFFQFGVQDSLAPHGAALSNALSGTEP